MKKFTMSLLLIFALGVTSVMAQGRTVSGKVTDSGTGLPIVGAMVVVAGTQNGAYTMEGGEFIVSNVDGLVNFEVTFMGYTEASVAVSASQTNVDIELTPSAMQMDEVVVVAYGTADKKSLTGSVAVLSSESMEDRPITNIASAISGMSPGILSTVAEGDGGGTPNIRIRGIGSINSSSEPLYVVDGVPFSGDISSIATNDIASMSVLKDAASTALYGSRASNGVIMIQTKSGRAGAVSFDVKITQGIMFRALPEYDKVNPLEFYELSWESERNQSYFGNKSSVESATNQANMNMFPNSSGTGAQYYNILTDNAGGLKMDNANVYAPTSWPGLADDKWLRGSLNPDARVMDLYAEDLDWMDQITKIGYRQNYSVSASGGTDKTSYYTSVGYLDETGYFDFTAFNRINARAKVDVTPTTWLKMGTNVSVSMSEKDNPFGDGNYMNNPWSVNRGTAPIYPVHLHNMFNGDYILDGQGERMFDMGDGYKDPLTNEILAVKRMQNPDRNMFYEGTHNSETTKKTILSLQAYAQITFLKDFRFTVDGSMNNTYTFLDEYENPNYGDARGLGRARNAVTRSFDNSFKQMLEWNRSFDKHNVDVLVGHEYFQRKYHYLEVNKMNEIFPGSKELDNFAEVNGNPDGYSMEYLSEGYFARANYNFDEKYYFTANFRRDASSKFSPENRWGNFWSVGASWIISSEDFMSNVMWVDFLKLRASYGTNGNDGGFGTEYVGYYQWQSTYSTMSYNNTSGLRRAGVGTPELQWETAGALDVGVDFRLFNKLNGSIGYYEKSSNELIFEIDLPVSSGISTELQNVGSMVNRGIEVALDADVIRTKDFVWNLGINIAWMQNRILSLPEGTPENGMSYDGSKRLKEGYSLYEWYLIQWGGIDPSDGSSYYVLDYDPEVETPTASETEFLKDGVWYTKLGGSAKYDFSGDGLAPISGAITSSLTWKNLTLDLLFTYRIGGKAYDSSYVNLMGGRLDSAMSADLLNSWRKPGDVTGLPRIQAEGSNHNYGSNYKLIDNSYIALQNVTLSYQFPKKIANKLTLEGLSVYLSGENLFQVSALQGYDALSSHNGTTNYNRFGSVATVSFGINVSF